MLYSNITETVGHTPLVDLQRLCQGKNVRILAKLESRNPCGSVKDRVGLALIEDARKRGVLKPGCTLVEPTSGNTGIALAFAASAAGYRLVLTMPERISHGRVRLLQFLGAEVVLTPGSLMRNAVDKARELEAEIAGAILLGQFDNPANPEIHRTTTAVEILQDCDTEVDVFVSGVGTGGTITGVGEVLKAHNPKVKIVAVEPAGAAVLSGRAAGAHFLPGLGAGFIPAVLNRDIIDQVIPVTEQTAVEAQMLLARSEGISAGISSGAALAAALHLAEKPEMAGKTFVVILPDLGERYVNHPMFCEISKAVAANKSAKG